MASQVKFVDFPAEYKSIQKEIDFVMQQVFKNGIYILGPEVSAFETEFSNYLKIKHVVGLASGTDALTIAINALELKKDDGVMLPANVYPSAFGVFRAGIKLELADVDEDTQNISLATVKKAITRDTKAIVVVHLYGNPVDILPIKKFAEANNLYLIEDCAQAAGSEYMGKKLGVFGDISCFSFYPTKNLGAYGDGGAIATNNEELYKKALLWRMYGEKERYVSIFPGMNSRLDELQAAILRVKLKYLDNWITKKRKLAKIYRNKLKDLPIEIVEETKNGKCSYHLFVIRLKDRDKLANYLKKNNIAVAVHYPIPIHLTESFKELGYKKGDFPISENASREVLSLPIYPQMLETAVNYVAEKIHGYFNGK